MADPVVSALTLGVAEQYHRFVLDPLLVKEAAARNQSIEIEFNSDGTSFIARLTQLPPAPKRWKPGPEVAALERTKGTWK